MHAFKDHFQAEKYLTYITHKWFRDSLTRFLLWVCGLKSCKRWFLPHQTGNDLSPMCEDGNEDEVHLLF